MPPALPVGTAVHFRKSSWPDHPKADATFETLGADAHGLWVGGRAGAPFALADGTVWHADVASVGCVRDGVTWNTWFFDDPRRNVYLDVFKESRWDGTMYAFVDLDLDVYGLEHPEIVDMDELEENSARYGYPESIVAEAWTNARAALADLESGGAVYAEGWRRLGEFASRGRAPRVCRFQAAIVEADRVLLLRNRHRDSGHTFWLPPGGGAEPGETDLECVRREVLEETSLVVEVERLLARADIIHESLYREARTYLCRVTGGTAAPGYEPEVDFAEACEIIDVGWFSLREPSTWAAEVARDVLTTAFLEGVRAALGYS